MALAIVGNDTSFDDGRRTRLKSDEVRFFANNTAKNLSELLTKVSQAYDPEGLAGVAIIVMLDYREYIENYFNSGDFFNPVQYCPSHLVNLDQNGENLDAAKYRQFNYGQADEAVLQMKEFDIDMEAAGDHRRDQDLVRRSHRDKLKFLSFIDEYAANTENVVWQFCVSVTHPYARERAMLLDRLETAIKAHFIDVMYVIEDQMP